LQNTITRHGVEVAVNEGRQTTTTTTTTMDDRQTAIEKDLFIPQSISFSGLRAIFLNIQTACAVANTIRSTYGPRGKSKLIIHEDKITFTNGNHRFISWF
jgi:hypothetical protein